MKHLDHSTVNALVAGMAQLILRWHPTNTTIMPKCYPVPRGGVPVAYLLKSYMGDITIVDDPAKADFFVDDLIDSGATRDQYLAKYPGKGFFALIDKDAALAYKGEWLVFPWERMDERDDSGNDIVVRLLQLVGEDAKREGLLETPARVVKAWRHWCSGYGKNPADIMKVFKDGGETYNQMVVVKDLPIYSHCEHHLAPIFGTASIAYIPNGKIVGLSKLSRLADMFARRLQVQERLTDQIADALVEHLAPIGAGVIIKARHLCMESRGICQQGHHTITTALRGAIKDEPQTRAEFLKMAG